MFNMLRVHGHIVAWHKGAIYLFPYYFFSIVIGMYCLNGTTGVDNQNTNEAVNPLFLVWLATAFVKPPADCDPYLISSNFKTGGFTM